MLQDTACSDYAETLDGVTLQVEDAQDDVGKQLNQIQNFVASGVDAIIVNPVDTSATQAMSDAAAAGSIPLVYVNREPINVDSLPDNQAFVASDEREAGTLETQEICRLLKEKGKGEGAKILVMMGELSNQAAQQRTADVHDVIATDECNVHEDRRRADRQLGAHRGQRPDDQLAVVGRRVRRGRLQQRRDGDRRDPGAEGGRHRRGTSYLIGGVDATQDALAAMAAGDLDVTVFQDAAGQGKGALDAALKLAKGEAVEQKVYIPFQLVTPANMADFQAKN